MASLNMAGPFTFSESGIDNAIQKNRKGNYALGSANQDGTLNVAYIGRSDSDLNAELKQRLGTHDYPSFKASYANSISEAYEKECQNYHDFGENKSLANEIHPAKPNSNHRCPICGQ